MKVIQKIFETDLKIENQKNQYIKENSGTMRTKGQIDKETKSILLWILFIKYWYESRREYLIIEILYLLLDFWRIESIYWRWYERYGDEGWNKNGLWLYFYSNKRKNEKEEIKK